MFMKGPGIVWLWNFSLRVQTWCEVRRCGFVIWLRSPFFVCSCGEGVSHGGLCRTKTGKFFSPPLRLFFCSEGFTFQIGSGGETRGRPLPRSACTRRNAPAQHFKCGWRQKAGLLHRYLILQQTQQKQKRLIYLNRNTSALAAVPACSGKCEVPCSHFKYWKIMFFFFFQIDWRLEGVALFPFSSQLKHAALLFRQTVDKTLLIYCRRDRKQIFVTFCFALRYFSDWSAEPANNAQRREELRIVRLFLLFITSVIF